jgi:tRNA(Ile)-lysidine synthase
MNAEIKPDKYVIAVSGGVDSVVLLDLLYSQFDVPRKNLVVAHFDHGIRENSSEDRKFVEKLAKRYNLEFFYGEGKLGPSASEAEARKKRYEFLEKIKKQTGANAIITAHHQDDLLETVVINLLRGTGRKGLSSLKSRDGLLRPLLNLSKADLLDYAREKKLGWREDETNVDRKYLRNYIRHDLLKKLSDGQKRTLLEISRQTDLTNKQIDDLLGTFFSLKNGISQQRFVSFDHAVAAEIIAKWLREEKVGFDKKTIDRLVVKLKTAGEGKIIQTVQGRHFTIRDGIIRMKTSGAV